MKATDKLRVYYMKPEQDIGGWHPLGQQTQCDLGYLLDALKPILASLERRGYDTKTFKLSVEPQQGNARFASQRGTAVQPWHRRSSARPSCAAWARKLAPSP